MQIFGHFFAILHLIDQHLAVLAIEGQAQYLARPQPQVTRLLILWIRVGLTAVPEFEQQAVLAGHQTIYHLVIYHVPFIFSFRHLLIQDLPSPFVQNADGYKIGCGLDADIASDKRRVTEFGELGANSIERFVGVLRRLVGKSE